MSLPLSCIPRCFTGKTELITLCCGYFLNWLSQIYFFEGIARTLQGMKVSSAKLCEDTVAIKKQVIQ